jgi:hypothetical protein
VLHHLHQACDGCSEPCDASELNGRKAASTAAGRVRSSDLDETKHRLGCRRRQAGDNKQRALPAIGCSGKNVSRHVDVCVVAGVSQGVMHEKELLRLAGEAQQARSVRGELDGGGAVAALQRVGPGEEACGHRVTPKNT